jgi:hypothetical protein
MAKLDERTECAIGAFLDVSRQLAEEILHKDVKTQLEKEYIYRFTLMTLTGFMKSDSKTPGCNGCKDHKLN